MEMLQLRYFYESAVNESFSKTAQSHMVPITSVSASIKRLEKELGCDLFVRSSNRVRLSPEGKRFYESVRETLAGLNKAVEDLKPQREEEPIRVLMLAIMERVTDWVIHYRKLYPTATFRLDMSRTNMESEPFDILVDEDSDKYPDYEKFPLMEFKLKFCCSKENPLCGRKVRLAELADQEFVALKAGGRTHKHLIKACESAGFQPKIVAMCNDVRCYRRLISAGVGMALMLEDGRIPAEDAQYLDVVDYDCTYRVMAYLRSGCKNEKACAFYEFLKNKAQV